MERKIGSGAKTQKCVVFTGRNCNGSAEPVKAIDSPAFDHLLQLESLRGLRESVAMFLHRHVHVDDDLESVRDHKNGHDPWRRSHDQCYVYSVANQIANHCNCSGCFTGLYQPTESEGES